MSEVDSLLVRMFEKISKVNQSINERSILLEYSLQALEQELDFLLERHVSVTKRQSELFYNVESRLMENNFLPLEYSEYDDDIEAITMCFNVYIEELKNKMISKDYFQEIFNEIPINVLILNENFTIENSNKNAIDYFSITGEYDEQNFEAVFSDSLLLELNKFANSRLSKKEIEFVILKDKHTAYLSGSLSKIHLKNQSYILFISKDITERKQQQMQLLKATIEGQEIERKRLAIEIHDSLGQELSSLKMNLNSIQKNTISTEIYQEVMSNVDGIVKSAVQTVKDISFNLKPTLLTTLNLRAAIVRLVEVMAIQPSNIQFICTDKELKLKNKNEELFVYRIIQEFLNNTFKHADASLITIVVRKNSAKKQFKITLSDNGIGFDLKDKRTSNGNGIVNIFHRLKILNADFTFDSKQGKGTYLEFYISY